MREQRRLIMLNAIANFIKWHKPTTGDVLRFYPGTRPLIEELEAENVIEKYGKRRWKLKS